LVFTEAALDAGFRLCMTAGSCFRTQRIVESPSRHQRSRDPSQPRSGFACGLPSAKSGGLTPAKRLNL